MPTYEFRCPNGHSFDQLHRISAVPSTVTCPTCGADAVQAISGGAGLVFKGSGFYLTDYGKNAHRGGSGPSKGGESGGGEGGSSSTKSESGGGSSGGDKAAPSASPPTSPSTPSSGSGSAKSSE